MTRRTRIALGGLALLTAGASWAVARYGEAVVAGVVARTFESRFGERGSLGPVAVGWLPPSVEIHDLELRGDADTRRLAIRRLDATLAWWASLWEGAWIVDLDVVSPDVRWSDDDPFWRELAAGESSGRGGPAFLPRRLAVRDGRVRWRLSGASAQGEIDDLRVDAGLESLLAASVAFEVQARGWIDRAGKRFDLRSIAATGRVATGRVSWTSLSLEGPDTSIASTGQVTEEALRGDLRWEGRLEPLLALFPEAGDVRGGGRIEAEVSGRITEPGIDARVEARDVVIEEVAFSGNGRLRSQGNEWWLEDARVRIFGGTVEAEATGRWSDGVPYTVRGRFFDWSPPVFLRRLGVDWPIRGAWSGRARLEGRLLGDDLEGGGSFQLVDGEREIGGEASFVIGASSAEVSGSLAHEPSRGAVRARYAVDSADSVGSLSWAGERMAPWLSFVGIGDVEGAGRIDAEIFGSADVPRLRGTAALRDLRVGAGRLGEVRGPFVLGPETFESEGLEAFDGRLRARGAFPLVEGAEGRWEASFGSLPLGEAAEALRTFWPAVPAIAAAGSVEGRLAGGVPGDALNGRFRATGFHLGAEGPFRLEATLTGGDDWRIDGRIEGEGELRGILGVAAGPGGALTGTLEANGRIEELVLVRDRWPSLAGTMRLAGTISGTTDAPRAEARLDLTGMTTGPERSLADALVDLALREDVLELNASSGEWWTLSGTAGLREEMPFEIDAGARDLDLGPWLTGAPDLAIRVTGAGRLRGTRGSPFGEGRAGITNVTVERGSVRAASVRPVEWVIRDGSLHLAPLTLRARDQEITLEGTVSHAASDVSARGRGDFRLLETLLPGVASARGHVDVDLRARHGPSGPWEVFGSARMRDAAMDLGFLVGVTEMSGEVVFDGSRAEIPGVTGSLGGGGFFLAGDVDRERGWNLGWALRDASLGVPEWLEYRASGDGRFRGPLDEPALTGEIEIVQALYDRRFEWGEFLPWFRREARRSRGGSALPIAVDLRVFSDGGVFVENNLVEAELGARLDVRGADDGLRWAGRVDVVGGEFVFRRRRFTISAGTIQFHERRPLNPDLEFRGETIVSTDEADYEIVVQVSGTAERPRVEFFADDPALTENDILALVTFGRSVSQLQAEGAGIELSEVLALTAGPRAGAVEERIYEFIPVDRIEIQPTFSRTTGAIEPRLSVGKDVTRELRAVLSTGLGSERQQDVALEYQLTPRVAVQGAWESQTKSQTGAFGGDLKFRVPFRTFRDFSPGRDGDPERP